MRRIVRVIDGLTYSLIIFLLIIFILPILLFSVSITKNPSEHKLEYFDWEVYDCPSSEFGLAKQRESL